MDYKETERLRKALRKEKNAQTYCRIHAVILTRVQGFDITKTAECVLRDPKWVHRWVDRYYREGLDGLSDRPREGRPPKANPRHVNKIISKICDVGSTPVAIQNEIKNKLGTTYSLPHTRKLMKRCGYSRKASTLYHINKATVTEQKAWHRYMKYLVPRTKSDGFTTVFLDEMFFVWNNAGRGNILWSPIGKRHYLKWNGARNKMCVYGALAADGRQLFRLHEKFNSEQFIVFLQEIHEKFGRVLIIMDKATPHKSKMLEHYIIENPGIRIEYIPTGCPEYNLVEACWYITKKDTCRSVFYYTFDDMCCTVSEYLRTHRFRSIVPSRYLFRKPLEIHNF